jgi:hypothetical protein
MQGNEKPVTSNGKVVHRFYAFYAFMSVINCKSEYWEFHDPYLIAKR